MNIELIGGIVALVLALIGGGVGWSEVRKHGQEKAKRKRAESDADAANEIAKRRGEPLETADERALSARAELRRRGVPDPE